MKHNVLKLTLTILLVSLLFLISGVELALAQVYPIDFVVTESFTDTLVRITSDGERQVIYSFAPGSFPNAVTRDINGDFIVSERDGAFLSRITPDGVRTVIYSFPNGTGTHGVAIDGNGDFIVTERQPTVDNLIRINRDGVRTVISTLPYYSHPRGVVVDSNGDFIVAEATSGKLVRITPAGVRTVIFNFPGGYANVLPHDIAIDDNGDYIVTTARSNKLFRITPDGIGTIIFNFPAGTYPIGVAIDSNGDYIVPGGTIGGGIYSDKLIRITPDGIGSIMFDFAYGTQASGIVAVPSVVPVDVSVDIKPQSCPNPINVKSNGVLPVAILGTGDFDVTQIDLSTVRLSGVMPLRTSLEDVATPFETSGKKIIAMDCTAEGSDGLLDLSLKFDTQKVIEGLETALGREVEDGEVLATLLTGALQEEFGGASIQGEDVVVILKKGKH